MTKPPGASDNASAKSEGSQKKNDGEGVWIAEQV
jgi:hypothetical protein